MVSNGCGCSSPVLLHPGVELRILRQQRLRRAQQVRPRREAAGGDGGG